jgi:hypothetical protein
VPAFSTKEKEQPLTSLAHLATLVVDMPNRSSEQQTDLRERLIALAREKRDEDAFHGGFGTNIGDLTQLVAGHKPERIIAALIELHEEGAIYLQRWNAERRKFDSWNSEADPKVFFADFRLVPKKPNPGNTSAARGGGHKDANVLAFDIVQMATGQKEKPVEKNPAAVSLGRLGGLKGGKARASVLTPEKRKEIAKKAAEKRWGAKH